MDNKAPVHDFAPSWLKISPIVKSDIDTDKCDCFDPDQFDLRPQYLKKEPPKKEISTNIASKNNVKEPGKGNYSPARHSSFDFDNELKKQLTSNNTSINSLTNNRRYSPRVKSDHNRRPHSRHDFREEGGNFYGLRYQYSVSKLKNCGDFVNEEKDNSKGNIKNEIVDSNTFKEEFPSLVDENAVNVKTSNGNNVWDNVKNKVLNASKKGSLVPRHVCASDSNGAENGRDDGFSRAFIPVVPKKKLGGLNGNGAKENGYSLLSGLSNLHLGGKIVPVLANKRSTYSPSQSMSILVKKSPKMRSNKNEFLKTLRSDSGPEEKKGLKNEEIKDQENGHSSSFLEAEERLLREMGWKENEDDNFCAPLTEDEVKEFHDLINARNSYKRHTNINQQILMSPKKVLSPLSYLSVARLEELENESSTSEDDDDEEA